MSVAFVLQLLALIFVFASLMILASQESANVFENYWYSHIMTIPLGVFTVYYTSTSNPQARRMANPLWVRLISMVGVVWWFFANTIVYSIAYVQKQSCIVSLECPAFQITVFQGYQAVFLAPENGILELTLMFYFWFMSGLSVTVHVADELNTLLASGSRPRTHQEVQLIFVN